MTGFARRSRIRRTRLPSRRTSGRGAASTVHVHPNGRFVYGANRAQETIEFQGQPVFKGGENSIVVYAIDLARRAETDPAHRHAGHPSAYVSSGSQWPPAGRATQSAREREGDTIKTLPAGLSVFRMSEDGTLTFARKYDVEVGDKTMFWMGMVPL